MKRIAVACTLVLAVTGATGACGEDQGDEGTTRGEASAVAGTPEPEAVDQVVEPADGLELEIDRLSLRVPDGWVEGDLPIEVPNTVAAQTPDESQGVMLTSPPLEAGPSMDVELIEANMRRDKFTILDPLELRGRTFSRGVRREDGTDTIRMVSMVGRYQTSVSFYFAVGVPEEERRVTTDAVLATLEVG